MEALVIQTTGKFCEVKNISTGQVSTAVVRGKFRIKGIKGTSPVVVGDRVFLIEDKGSLVVDKVYPRENYIIRKSVKLSKSYQILGANIHQAFFFFTLKNPETHLMFLDRFLISAEAYNIPVTILFNKSDELSSDELLEIKRIQKIYKDIGYKSFILSATEDQNFDEFKILLKDKITLFAGHSGVGKSTLINSLDKNLKPKIGETSLYHQQGQHTTTFSRLYDWDFGGFVIDTPGIRGFGLVEMEKEELKNYFPEFVNHQNECKFHNCTHTNEPNCAIKQKVESGEISKSRYKNYLLLFNDEETNNPYRQKF